MTEPRTRTVLCRDGDHGTCGGYVIPLPLGDRHEPPRPCDCECHTEHVVSHEVSDGILASVCSCGWHRWGTRDSDRERAIAESHVLAHALGMVAT